MEINSSYAEASKIWKTQQTQKQDMHTEDTMEISQPKLKLKVQDGQRPDDQNKDKNTSTNCPQAATSSNETSWPTILTANIHNQIPQPPLRQATTSVHTLETKPTRPTHFIATANDEQIVDFICKLIISFTEGKTEEDINALVMAAAKRLLQQKREHLVQHGRD